MRFSKLATSVFFAVAAAGCGDNLRHIEISSNTMIGNNQKTYFDCDTEQLCSTTDTRVIFGRGGVIGRQSKSCTLASADDVARYQAICKKQFSSKSPD